METLIGACGLVCSKCKAFIATRTKNETLAEETAQEWSQFYGATVLKEHVWCTGCLTEASPKCYYCGNLCEIRKCVGEKGIDNCAACMVYPCEKVKTVAEGVPATRKIIEALRG